MNDTSTMQSRASALSGKSFEQALLEKSLPAVAGLQLSEAIVLGLIRQNVRRYFTVFGHGSTALGEVLRVYADAGAIKVLPLRNETEAAHAATALRWVTGEKAAVVTSIGPGAMHAFSGALASASNGVGVWHLYGDESTEDEGPNMQQIPRAEQGLFHRLTSVLGNTYTLHTPSAVTTALRRGINTVDDPHRAGPYFLLLPINTQSAVIEHFRLDSLPGGEPPRLGPAHGAEWYEKASRVLRESKRVVVRVGGGASAAGAEILELLDLVDGLAVVSPRAPGVIPASHPRNMGVGGSKGSICGNAVMEEADALLVIGSRSVCQSDSSRTGYPQVQQVVNVNVDVDAALHYARTTALLGDAAPTLRRLIEQLRKDGAVAPEQSDWLNFGADKKLEWQRHKDERYSNPTLFDEVWQRPVLTQPAAVKIVTDWAVEQDLVRFFDAGDVQANGFQVIEDELPGRTFSETGASYMGFAVSALLASAASENPFYSVALTGDGSFTMNPQILIDGVTSGAQGCIVLFDNRRMGAISSLQRAQYGIDFATNDNVAVNYVKWAGAVEGVLALDGGSDAASLRSALNQAKANGGLSLIWVPVYFGEDVLGGLGTFGRWNVGPWVEDVQALRHKHLI